MGHGSHVLHMIFIIIFFLISFYCTHTLIAKASINAQGYFTIVPGPKEVYYTSNNGHIHKVPGGVGNQDQKKVFLFEKFKVLLRLKSFSIEKSRNGDSALSTSPSPSPAPVPGIAAGAAPAPSPVHHTHRHAHPPWHHHHSLPQAHKMHKKDQGKNTRVLTAVLASVGITSVLCAIGLFFGCRKFKKQKRRQRRSISVFRAEAGSRGISKFISSQSSVKKVTSDPGPDLFYLHSLESALEPEKCCMKLDSSTEKTYSNQNTSNCTLDERDGSKNKLINSESESGRCSSFGEITSVHEISESIKHEPYGSNSSFGERIIPEEIHTFDDNIVPDEAHSSDDESFHSFCESHSSQLRLSNASACSLGETSEIISHDEVKETNCSLAAPPKIPQPPPPPPPPPPATPPLHFPCSTKTKSNFLNPSTLPNLSKSSFPLSPSIPPPPCPPPLSNGHVNPLKAPPPPPSLLTQQMPLGKDGSPLPKLKPLHWDKVRAAPNRSTVWDKLRSSSFE